MGAGGPFPEAKRSRGVTLTTHPHLAPKSRTNRSYISYPPWHLHGSSGTVLLYFIHPSVPGSTCQTPWHQNPKIHHRIHNPPPAPILSQLHPLHTPQLISPRSILILPSHQRLGLPSDLFPSGFPIKPCTFSSPLPFVPHAPLTSPSLT
jgi:hypothetical protein